MYELKKRFRISAAHRLHNETLSKDVNKKWFGKCNELHGHNYNITLILRYVGQLDPSGMIINFDELKVLFKKYIDDVYDHKLLNNCPGFEEKVVTAELMAHVFYDRLKPKLKELYGVEVEETDGASATYYKA